MSWHTGLEWIGAWRELPGQMLEEISALDMGVRGVGAGNPWDLPGAAQRFSAEKWPALEVASLRHSRNLLMRFGSHPHLLQGALPALT